MSRRHGDSFSFQGPTNTVTKPLSHPPGEPPLPSPGFRLLFLCQGLVLAAAASWALAITCASRSLFSSGVADGTSALRGGYAPRSGDRHRIRRGQAGARRPRGEIARRLVPADPAPARGNAREPHRRGSADTSRNVIAVRIGVTGDGCELVRGPVLPGNRGGGPHARRPGPLPRRPNGDRDRRPLGPLRGDRTSDAHAAGLRLEPAVRRRIGLLLRATGGAAGPRRGGLRAARRPARRAGQPSPAGAAYSPSRT